MADIARQLGMQPNELPIPECLGQPESVIASRMGLLEGSTVTLEKLDRDKSQGSASALGAGLAAEGG